MFPVAPGTLTALTGQQDQRAYYIFSGDLGQMGTMEDFLRRCGLPVVKSGVYPGFVHEADYIEGLRRIWDARIEGWWNSQTALVKYKICTQEEFTDALQKA